MWPPGHAAVAYLCYAAYLRVREDRTPGEVGALVVAVAAQVPDVIDKPLAWTFGILEYGRALGHSVLVIVPVMALLWWWLGDDYPDIIAALGVGWLSHLLGDAVGSVIEWELVNLGYVVWPLVELPPPEIEQSFVGHLLALELGPGTSAELVAIAVALVVWRRDGYPGLETVQARLVAGVRALPR